ncbi:MAG: NPCBM/NEW2 domain-containing protein [Pirellulales bacterium]|nr:NPCBM/NEW2 domain-containing protein [Pirellulales bacterium]
MSALLACAILLGLSPAAHAVLVIANQSTGTVSFKLEIGSRDAEPHVLSPGQVLPVLTDDRVRVSYLSGKELLSESLEHRAIYYFLAQRGRPLLHDVAIDVADKPRWRPIVRASGQARRAAKPSETIKVKILVDRYHSARKSKSDKLLERRVEQASRFVEQYAGVRFDVVEHGTWPGVPRGTYERRQMHLTADTLDEPFDLVLGFETPITVDRLGRPKGHDDRVVAGRIRSDDELQPVAEPFSRAIVIAGHDSRLSELHRVQQVIIALASYLGAVESPQFGSALRSLSPQKAIATRKPSSVFIDPPNALVVALVGQAVRQKGALRLADLDGRSRNTVEALRVLSRTTAMPEKPERFHMPRGRSKDELLYDAAFADGSVELGARLEDWDAKSHKLRDVRYARLGGRRLLDSLQPVVWLRHQGATVGEPEAGFVEFHGGDRLPGESVEFRQAAGVFPAHLVVDVGSQVARFKNRRQRIDGVPKFPRANPEAQAEDEDKDHRVRVRTRWLRRIVRGRPVLDRYEPSVLVTVDGRRIEYRSFVLLGKRVRVLEKGEIHEIAVADIAELHFPEVDQWQAYYEQLAAHSLDVDTTLVQCETAWGLRATSNVADVQRRMAPYDGARSKRHPHESYFPVWSLDELWIDAYEIGQRRFFRPAEVPLSLFLPSSERRTTVLAGRAPWQLNHSVAGGSLTSGGLEFAWGFGVQATSRLEFLLPQCAVGFQSWVGLDASVGGGGCARAMVHVNSAVNKPIYASGVLMGSANVIDTGVIPLRSNGKTPWRLTLVADASHDDRPAGADPWDVRDRVNWHEPRLLLDVEQLELQVERFRSDAVRTAAR